MTYEELYNKLDVFATNQGYSVDQIKNVTWKQVATRFNNVSFTGILWERVRDDYCRAKIESETQITFNQFKTMMTDTADIIKDKFPNVEYERGEKKGLRFFTIWLDGKPEVIEPDEGPQYV